MSQCNQSKNDENMCEYLGVTRYLAKPSAFLGQVKRLSQKKGLSSMCGLERCAPVSLGAEWARGAFGSVHVVDAPSAPTGRVAVKRVAETPGHVNRELETCMRLALDPHAGIVRVLGYWTEKQNIATTEEAEQFPVVESTPHGPVWPPGPPGLRTLFLVMEFLPETLRGVLNRLAESTMRMKAGRMTSMVGQLASALGHLEKMGVMHRDLKPENVLVDVRTSRVVLCDFGSAKFVERDCDLGSVSGSKI
jgi:serine/threonine protein kinase